MDLAHPSRLQKAILMGGLISSVWSVLRPVLEAVGYIETARNLITATPAATHWGLQLLLGASPWSTQVATAGVLLLAGTYLSGMDILLPAWLYLLRFELTREFAHRRLVARGHLASEEQLRRITARGGVIRILQEMAESKRTQDPDLGKTLTRSKR